MGEWTSCTGSEIHTLTSELLAGEEELAWHTTQLTPSAAEYLPTPQAVQVFELVAPVPVEDVPPAQLIHVPVPEVFLYFPAWRWRKRSVSRWSYINKRCTNSQYSRLTKPSGQNESRGTFPLNVDSVSSCFGVFLKRSLLEYVRRNPILQYDLWHSDVGVLPTFDLIFYLFIYYESTKRKLKTKNICGCRCYERPKTKEFTRLIFLSLLFFTNSRTHVKVPHRTKCCSHKDRSVGREEYIWEGYMNRTSWSRRKRRSKLGARVLFVGGAHFVCIAHFPLRVRKPSGVDLIGNRNKLSRV